MSENKRNSKRKEEAKSWGEEYTVTSVNTAALLEYIFKGTGTKIFSPRKEDWLEELLDGYRTTERKKGHEKQ